MASKRGMYTQSFSTVRRHRALLEINAFFAPHRHYDLSPAARPDTLAEAAAVNAIINAYTWEPHHAAHPDKGNRTAAAHW